MSFFFSYRVINIVMFSQVSIVAHGPLVHLHMTQGNKVTSSEHEFKLFTNREDIVMLKKALA